MNKNNRITIEIVYMDKIKKKGGKGAARRGGLPS